jgi:ATP-dependent RNA helicase DHX29
MSNSSENMLEETDNVKSEETNGTSISSNAEERGKKEKDSKESRGGKSSRSNSVTQTKGRTSSNGAETANGHVQSPAGKATASASATAEEGNKSGKGTLPIDAYREEILRRVNRDRVTIIHGETGCGKSSRLPLILLEDAEEKGKACKMMVSQPRRIAASSLMKRLRGLVGNKVSF